MELSYTLAFTTGLLGGFGHCIGMCGPLVAPLSLTLSHKGRGNYLPHILYNTGRITTYSFIGALMGFSGSFVNIAGRMSGFQNAVAVLAGAVMILMGLSISGIARKITWLERHNNFILRAGKDILQSSSAWRYYPLGLLFGFMPCGLSYTAFIAAAGTGSLVSGMLVAFFFGIGTAPALLLFGVVISLVSPKIRGIAYRISGVMVMAFGVYFIFKGIYHHA